LEDNYQSSVKTVIQATRGFTPVNFHDLWQYRELIYFLVWRDIKIRYKQSLLGITWVIFQPVISTVIFTVLFGVLLRAPSGEIPYPVFALSGLLPWTYFAYSINRSSGSLVLNANLISKIYFPRIAVPLASTLSGLLDFSISFLVLLGVMAYYGLFPTISIVLLPLYLLFSISTALGFGLWLSALNVRYRDINQLTPFIIQIWMYLTPVIYAVTLIPDRFRFILTLNPMTAVVDGFRLALLGPAYVQSTQSGWILVIPVCISVAVLFSGAIYFRQTEKNFSDVI
jgi:lipopolysaccharide transport system permease protein